jgi:Cys-rich protein (TIGR01571 family)
MKPRGNRNALNREIGEDGLRDWSFGLFDCCSTGRLCNKTYPIGPSFLYALTWTLFFFSFVTGCSATFCPCVVYGQNRQRLRQLHRHATPLQGEGERCNQDCRLYCCMAVPCFFWVFQVCSEWWTSGLHVESRGIQMGSRSDIRNRYDIRGESHEDCLNSLCCRPCALTQESREIELEEKSFSS